MEKIRSICVYCGSSPGNNPAYMTEAKVLGAAMAGAGISLVYGGGDRGIMGAVAKSILENGGKAVGIIPEFLLEKERSSGTASLELTEIVITKNMHERKQMRFERADAFVALPGGIGTLEELIEILTWAQLGRHDKPIALLDTDGFWSKLIDLFDHMDQEGFIHTAHLIRPIVMQDADEIVPKLLEQ